MRTVLRRGVSVGALGAVFLVLGALAPLWGPALLLVGVVRRRGFILLRLTTFAWIYATMQGLGVVRAVWIGLAARGDRERFLEANYRLQRWWSETLFRAMRATLGLRIEVEGREAVRRGPLLLLMRHTSLVDTLLPAHLVANANGIRLRYVLKRELLADPCLDIVGHRLPNYFVDRNATSEADVAALRELATGLGPRDGVVIYPEGTYFSAKKREQILARLRERGSPLLARAARLERTLPPRLGGVLALLDGAPEADVVVCAHEGLDGVQRLGDIAGGALVGATIRVAFWRVPRAAVPRDEAGRTDWLFEEWARVDARARAA